MDDWPASLTLYDASASIEHVLLIHQPPEGRPGPASVRGFNISPPVVLKDATVEPRSPMQHDQPPVLQHIRTRKCALGANVAHFLPLRDIARPNSATVAQRITGLIEPTMAAIEDVNVALVIHDHIRVLVLVVGDPAKQEGS